MAKDKKKLHTRSRSMDDTYIESLTKLRPRVSLLASESIVERNIAASRLAQSILSEKEGDAQNQKKQLPEEPPQSNRGLVNLCILLLVLTNFRMVVSNLLQYGPLFLDHIVSSSQAEFDYENWSGLFTFMSLFIYIFFSLVVEKVASMGSSPPAPKSPKSKGKSNPQKRFISSRMATVLRVINLTCLLVLPNAWLVLAPAISLVSRLTVCMWGTVVFLKITSYVVENSKECEAYWSLGGVSSSNFESDRDQNEKKIEKDLLRYPQNLTVSNMFIFFWMPTLCYNINYPRTQSIRWLWLLRRVMEFVVLSLLIWGISVQYILPIVQKTPLALQRGEWFFLLERLLKLAVPNLYVWLTGFYVMFHVYLNILAEITFSADRMFYGDWWNATTLEYFWRNWNLPVHTWLVRYVYKPSLQMGYQKYVAYLLVFFVSAVFHELIVAVAFGTLRLWAFWAMFLQIPLISITRGMKGSASGNVIFWLSISLGQAFCVIMYYNYALEFN